MMLHQINVRYDMVMLAIACNQTLPSLNYNSMPPCGKEHFSSVNVIYGTSSTTRLLYQSRAPIQLDRNLSVSSLPHHYRVGMMLLVMMMMMAVDCLSFDHCYYLWRVSCVLVAMIFGCHCAMMMRKKQRMLSCCLS